MKNKSLFLFLFLLFSVGGLSAQKKLYISPSAGVAYDFRGDTKEMFYSELEFGYEVSRKVRLSITGGYGTRSDNDLYTLVFAVTPFSLSTEKFIFESSLGAGIQHRDFKHFENKTRFVGTLNTKIGYYFIPRFGMGIDQKVFFGDKKYNFTSSNIFLAFRF